MTVVRKVVTSVILILFASISVVFPFSSALRSDDDPTVLFTEAKRLGMLENWYASAPLFERAESLFAAAKDQKNQTYSRIGRIRSRAEEMSQREASQLLAQELASPIVQSDDRLRLWCLMNKGDIDLFFDSPAAKRDWTEALEIANRVGDRQWIARATGHLGVMEFLEGNTTLAESHLTKAIKSAYFIGDIGAQLEFFAVAGIGFNEQHRFAEALPLLQRAIELAERTKGAGFPYLAYQGLGSALIARGDIGQARSLLNKALASAHSENQHGQEAFFLVLLGDASIASGDVEGGKDYYQQAGRLFTSVHFDRGLDEAMVKLANIDRNQGKLEDAANALVVALKTGPSMDAFYRPRVLTSLGELRVAQGRFSEATALFEAAEDVRESILIKLHSPLEIAAMAGSMSETYLDHFSLAVRLRDVPRAFAILERVRGRTSASLLYTRASEPAETPAEAALSAKIDAVQRSLMEAEDPQRRSGLLGLLYQFERELAIADNESAIDRQQLPPRAVTVSSVQKALRNDEVLLEYVVAEPVAFCIAVSNHKAEIIRLSAGSKRIETLVDSYLQEIKSRRSETETAKDLYSILLGPILKKFNQNRLIISPDGPLAFLPFEALRDARSEFLIRSRTVFYVPSASEFHVIRTASSKAFPTRSLLAVGDVDYGAIHVRRPDQKSSLAASIFRGLADFNGTRLEPLPSSRDEVLAIAHTFDSSAVILTGKQATETEFKGEPLSEFRVIHLATHAMPDPRYPVRAAVILGADDHDDGLLQVREIIRFRLRAELVTLSACETGVGTLQGEAGMASLEQAFLTAGAKSTVGSLWKVEDYSTSALMKEFYRHLAEGEDKATALRGAKLDFLQRNAEMSPYYWAGFTLWGEGSGTAPLAAKSASER
jgi:CHAT domain-containing protein